MAGWGYVVADVGCSGRAQLFSLDFIALGPCREFWLPWRPLELSLSLQPPLHREGQNEQTATGRAGVPAGARRIAAVTARLLRLLSCQPPLPPPPAPRGRLLRLVASRQPETDRAGAFGAGDGGAPVVEQTHNKSCSSMAMALVFGMSSRRLFSNVFICSCVAEVLCSGRTSIPYEKRTTTFRAVPIIYVSLGRLRLRGRRSIGSGGAPVTQSSGVSMMSRPWASGAPMRLTTPRQTDRRAGWLADENDGS